MMSTPENKRNIGSLIKRIMRVFNPKRYFEVLEAVKDYQGLKRIVGQLLLLLVIALGGWAAFTGLTSFPTTENRVESTTQPNLETQPAKTRQVKIVDLPSFAGGGGQGIFIERRVDVHTVFPSRPRLDIIEYVVKEGDTLFGIALNFGLKPESILWGNFDVLGDNPHSLQPDQVLSITPVDGTLHEWSEGEGLTGVADFYGVTVADILDWPGNKLSPDIDLDDPPIPAGGLVIVPGGTREFIDWSAPRIPRSNPSVASILGPGYCGSIYDGPIGYGSFIWPTPLHYLSGFDYSPATNHFAIDIAGDTGHTIWAMDAGVVVYSGWHNGGYGNVIVLDHGNGWQTLYAHLSTTFVGCGAGVFQGTAIGAMGSTGNSTGPHLHLEMRHDIYGKVNPWNYLP